MHLDVRQAHIPELAGALEQVAREIAAQLGGLSAAQLNWKPNPEEWSLGQCVDHMIVANSLYFPQLEQLLAGTKPTTFWERLPLAPALFGRMLITTLLPGRMEKVPTSKVFYPTSSAVDPQILQAFAAQQARLAGLMRACAERGHDAGRTVITSPAAPFVTYSLLDAFRIIVVHEQHHFVHTAKIMALPGFPRS